MSNNRHQRRIALREFRKDASKGHLLITHLIGADALDDQPQFARAVSLWRGNIKQRQPFCLTCRANFADAMHVGAFLFAMPAAAPTLISVTAICAECWRDLPDDVVEREATKVLRQLLPRGQFIERAR